MTVEQVLVFLLAAMAGIFLFLGLAQALDDRSARSSASPPAGRRMRRDGGSAPEPRSLPDGIPSEASQTTVARPPIPSAAEAGPTRGRAQHPPAARARFAAELDLVMVEDAMGLCLGGKHEELLALLEPRLAADREVGAEGQRSHVMTALHSLAGLARHALR